MSRAWSLRELLAGICESDDDTRVTGLAIDSRSVKAGDLFLAFPGTAADGRRFISDALACGASAVLYETNDFTPPLTNIPCLGVPALRQKLGAIADRFFASPSRELIVVGVTGTNGKTTCTQLLAQAINMSRTSEPTPPLFPGEGQGEGGAAIPPRGEGALSPALLPQAGEGISIRSEPLHAHGARRCGIIGTLGYGFPGALNASLHTTPDAVTVQRLLREFRDAGAGYACMEVSSHALDQGRVNAVAFHVGMFTNLTRDHLDYHGDMQAYGAAKAGLFATPGLKAAVINVDDDFGRGLLSHFVDGIETRAAGQGRPAGGFGKSVRVVTYGLEHGGVTAKSLKLTPKGITLRIASPAGTALLSSPLLGRFNAYNLLASFATLLALGFNPADAAHRLSRAKPAAGRMERFGGQNDDPIVVVDYAHTPDALEQVLNALRAHTRGKLVCVFGCGGDRDRGKRPLMGAIAEALADRVILTDDNPRSEDPHAILDEIRAGMKGEVRIIGERRAAIAEAIGSADAGDIVLVAGKGHEDYQQVGNDRLPYSDRATVQELLGTAA